MGTRKGSWETLSSEIVHQNSYYAVRKDNVIRPNGKPGTYHVVEVPPAVFIIAIDEHQHVYLEKLYRYPIEQYSIEIPAGGSDGQDPLEAAKRELAEEIGIGAHTWQQLSVIYASNGILNEENHVFIATDLYEMASNDRAEEGIESVMKVPYMTVLHMIKSGEINDSKSIAALMRAALELGWS